MKNLSFPDDVRVSLRAGLLAGAVSRHSSVRTAAPEESCSSYSCSRQAAGGSTPWLCWVPSFFPFIHQNSNILHFFLSVIYLILVALVCNFECN